MNAHLVLPQNNTPLNRAAKRWLEKAKGGDPTPHDLHLLSLAYWGLENRVQGEWPDRDRYALEQQVHGLLGWKAEDALAWLLGNPEAEEDPKEQEAHLLNVLKQAKNARLSSFACRLLRSGHAQQ